MKIFIIYPKIYDYDGIDLTVGGIQTYLLNLAKVFVNYGIEVSIYQLGNKNWEIDYNGIKIYGVNRENYDTQKKQSKLLFNTVLNVYNKGDIVIWGTNNITIKNININSIAIQHGISFDYTPENSKLLRLIKKIHLESFYKFLQRRKAVIYFLNTRYKVCVDYNFLNWIRTMVSRKYLDDIEVIPNFTHINNQTSINEQDSDYIYILFARRFVTQRGIFILIDIIDAILKKYNNVKFTIAGEGEYEKLLKKRYENNQNVFITKYKHHESLSIHTKHHIALVPTYGSEGTSLSLLEAMTSGCVPITSNVGGMTNIILDNFNGYLVNPNAKDFIKKIELLIENQDKRISMSQNAKLSINEAFSYDIWASKWMNFIDSMKMDID